LAGTREIGIPDLAGIGGIGNTEIPISTLPGSGVSAPMPRHRGFRGLEPEAPGRPGGTRDSEDSGAVPESPWASCALERFVCWRAKFARARAQVPWARGHWQGSREDSGAQAVPESPRASCALERLSLLVVCCHVVGTWVSLADVGFFSRSGSAILDSRLSSLHW
jgi:hypothetical protein